MDIFHGACIVKEGNKYYLFGEYHTDNSNAFTGFSCYSSSNLTDWKFEKIVLPLQADGFLGPDRIGERVKVMRCPATGEYVMFMHTDNLKYSDPHDGTRKYFIDNEEIHIVGEKIDKVIPRETFGGVANAILDGMKTSSEDLVTSPDGVEEFLDGVSIFDLEARTDDRTDFYIAFYHVDSPLVGFNVRSRMNVMNPILDGGRTANLKFEQTGIKFANPMINNVNALETPNVVADRMLLIERLGGVLKYADVADKVFRCNLLMIDLHFPRMIAEMLRIMQIEGITKVSELVDCIKEINPLKIKEDLIVKNGFYEYKMKQFLVALALGMPTN